MKPILGFTIALALVIMAAPASAEVRSLTTSTVVLLPVAEGGAAVAMTFDLASLNLDEGMYVEEACLELRISELEENETVEFDLYPILNTWSAPAAQTNASVVECPEEPAISWDVTPLDNQRNGRGFVRFNIREMLREWTSGTRANYGVVLRSEELSNSLLESGRASVRLIVL